MVIALWRSKAGTKCEDDAIRSYIRPIVKIELNAQENEERGSNPRESEGVLRVSSDTEHPSDVTCETERVEHWEQIEEGFVVRVMRPALDGDAIH